MDNLTEGQYLDELQLGFYAIMHSKAIDVARRMGRLRSGSSEKEV
jgi:hypothetical protein